MKEKMRRCIVCGYRGARYPVVSGLCMCRSCKDAFNLGVRYATSKEYTEKDAVVRLDILEKRINDTMGRLSDLANVVRANSRRGPY